MQTVEIETLREFSGDNVVRKVPFETDRLRVILLFAAAGTKTTPYKVPTSDAFLYILEGRGFVRVGEEECPVAAGSIVFIPRETERSMRAIEDMVALSAAAPPQQNLAYPPPSAR